MHRKKVKPSYCPQCGDKLDGAANVQGEDILPESGDYSVCIECTSYLKYDDNMDLVLVSEEELLNNPILLADLSGARSKINLMKKVTHYRQREVS